MSKTRSTVIPEDFVRRMIGVERMRNIVLQQEMAKLRVALGFDKWSSTGKKGHGAPLRADDVAMEKHIAHLEDDLYHAQQSKAVEQAKFQRELEDLRRQLEVALSEQAASNDAKVWALEQDNDDLRYENRQLRVELWTMRHIRWGMLQWRARVKAWRIKRARQSFSLLPSMACKHTHATTIHTTHSCTSLTGDSETSIGSGSLGSGLSVFGRGSPTTAVLLDRPPETL